MNSSLKIVNLIKFVIPQVCDSIKWDPRGIDYFEELYARITSKRSRAGADQLFRANGEYLADSFYQNGGDEDESTA